MYNHQLDTFLVAAKEGSFTKAAKQLYISPSAVLQQIKLLEQDLDASLFIRTSSGLLLTPAGKYLESQAQQFKEWNYSVRAAIKQLDAQSRNTLHVGVPKMHKIRYFYELWVKYSTVHPGYSIEFVESSSYSPKDINATYSSADIVEFIRLPVAWQEKMNFLKLGNCRIMFCVPKNHPLAGSDLLRACDIAGHTIVVDRGPFRELLRDYISELEIAGAYMEYVDHYSPSVLERCLVDKKIILLPSCSSHIHPLIAALRYQHDFTVPYGFFYSETANSGKDSFINFVNEQITHGDFIWEE